MSANFTVQVSEQLDMNYFSQQVTQQLQGMGYAVQNSYIPTANGFSTGLAPMNLTVSKDFDGIKKLIGLGVECTVNILPVGTNALSVSIDSTWGNKALAIGLGWFLCFVPFITGIVGCVSQSGMPKKIQYTIQNCAYSR